MKFLHATRSSVEEAHGDPGAERAALTRLRIASNLSGGTAVQEFDVEQQAGHTGWWFMLRLGSWRTKVADAVLSIRGPGTGVLGTIEHFMQQANLDVARVSIVRPADERADIAREAQTRRVWFFQAYREYRDVLALDGGSDGLLTRLGAHTRRNIRRTARTAQTIGLNFAFRDHVSTIDIDDSVTGLAAQNKPAAVSVGNIAIFEQMLSYRPTSFDARITTADGALISLCRGFITGHTAYLVYQMNNPAVRGINLGLFQTFKVIEELTARGVTEAIFVMDGRGLLKAACRVSSKEELITVRPSVRGLAMTILLATALKGTRFGEAMRHVLRSIVRHWMRLPKLAYDHPLANVVPPGAHWLRAVAGFVGLTVSVGAIGAAILVRSGAEYLPYITAYPAIMLATYLAGTWTGLLTVAVGGLGILYFVVPPYDSFALESEADMLATGLYVFSAFPLWRWFSRFTTALNRA